MNSPLSLDSGQDLRADPPFGGAEFQSIEQRTQVHASPLSVAAAERSTT